MTLPPYDDWSAAGTITCQLKIKVNDDTTIKQNEVLSIGGHPKYLRQGVQ